MSTYRIHTINSQLDDLRLTQLLTRLGAESGFQLLTLDAASQDLQAELVATLKECQRQCWAGARRRSSDSLLQRVKSLLEKAGGM